MEIKDDVEGVYRVEQTPESQQLEGMPQVITQPGENDDIVADLEAEVLYIGTVNDQKKNTDELNDVQDCEIIYDGVHDITNELHC